MNTYLSRLLQVLAPSHDVVIERYPNGYVLAVDAMAVDLHRFGRLAEQAQAAEDDLGAAALLAQALGLWRGEAFGTLDTPWLNAAREVLNAKRLAAELDRNDVGLRLCHHAELLGDMSAAAATHPWDEQDQADNAGDHKSPADVFQVQPADAPVDGESKNRAKRDDEHAYTYTHTVCLPD
ncbi:MAG TPA: BTAD domain-containing putative transcriptional regulator, partial [Candidatus Limnocylindrales bacterium]|nr:BTAD domain-containing putative transcriptional regulator [Candidatus Limnocylindrales bacterium]